MDSSTTSSIIGALGGGSGVDMTKLASDLSAARFASQVQQLQQRSDLMETRISAASTLKSQLSQLAAALGDRIRGGALAPAGSVAQPGVASVSAAAGSAPRGSFSLEVTQLASSQTLAGKTYASADSLVGDGTLTLQFGTVQGTSFAPDGSRAPVAITVTAQDTLATLAGKINAAGSGITAYVATGTGGAQLVLKAPEGAVNGFSVSGSGPSAAGGGAAEGNIDYLDWSPSADTGQLKQTARDAAFRLDGIDMTNSGNQVTGLAGGMSLTLTGTNAGAPTQITFASRNSEIASTMNDLVSALNEVASQLNESGNPLGGELGNDTGARALKRSLSALAGTVVMPNAAPGEPRTLGDLGLTLTRDGTFQLDDARLNSALSNAPVATGAMFTTGLYGVFGTIDKLARTIGNSGDPGSLGGSITRYTKAKTDIADNLAKIADKQEALRSQLARSFTWADRDISSSQSTLSFLKGQIDAWNAQKN